MIGNSLDICLVGQPLALGARDETAEPLHRVVFDVALVEPKGKLVNVAVQMLRAGVVIGPRSARA